MRINSEDTADLRQQVLKFEKARNNLLAVILFTVVNLFLSAFNANLNFVFSATLPQLVFEVVKAIGSDAGSNIFIIAGLIIAFITIIPYFIFWILARRARGLILAALIFFGIDSFLLIILVLDMESKASFLLEIVFHAWILYYLITGVIAWFKLRDVSKDEFKAILQEIKPNKAVSTTSFISPVPDNQTAKSSDQGAKEEEFNH